MATVTEVRVDVTYTKSLPNYENIKPSAGVTMTVAAGENPKDVFKQGWDMCGNEISEQLAMFQGQSKSGVKKGL